MTQRFLRIDLDLIVSNNVVRPRDQADNELWLAHTGDQLVDNVVRHYYAALPPLRALVVLRNDLDLADLRDAAFARVLIGWDDGDNPFVLAGQEGKRHTKISVDATLYHVPSSVTEITPLSDIIRQVPRADRPGGADENSLKIGPQTY